MPEGESAATAATTAVRIALRHGYRADRTIRYWARWTVILLLGYSERLFFYFACKAKAMLPAQLTGQEAGYEALWRAIVESVTRADNIRSLAA